MDNWNTLDWTAYICIWIAAAMPALGILMTARDSVRRYTGHLANSRWWKVVPAVALILSAVIIGYDQVEDSIREKSLSCVDTIIPKRPLSAWSIKKSVPSVT